MPTHEDWDNMKMFNDLYQAFYIYMDKGYDLYQNVDEVDRLAVVWEHFLDFAVTGTADAGTFSASKWYKLEPSRQLLIKDQAGVVKQLLDKYKQESGKDIQASIDQREERFNPQPRQAQTQQQYNVLLHAAEVYMQMVGGNNTSNFQMFVDMVKEGGISVDPNLKALSPFLDNQRIIDRLKTDLEVKDTTVEEIPDQTLAMMVPMLAGTLEMNMPKKEEYDNDLAVREALVSTWKEMISVFRGETGHNIPGMLKPFAKFFENDANVDKIRKAVEKQIGYSLLDVYETGAPQQRQQQPYVQEHATEGEDIEVGESKYQQFEDMAIGDMKDIDLKSLSVVLNDVPKEDDIFGYEVKRFIVENVDYPSKSGIVRRTADSNE